MFKIEWTEHAKNELAKTLEYLNNRFSRKEIISLQNALEKAEFLISAKPYLFQPIDERPNVRGFLVKKFNTLYYTIDESAQIIYVVSFFSNRQDPDSRKLS